MKKGLLYSSLLQSQGLLMYAQCRWEMRPADGRPAMKHEGERDGYATGQSREDDPDHRESGAREGHRITRSTGGGAHPADHHADGPLQGPRQGSRLPAGPREAPQPAAAVARLPQDSPLRPL